MAKATRHWADFNITDDNKTGVHQQCRAWAATYADVCILDDRSDHTSPHHRYEMLIGAGRMTVLRYATHAINNFQSLQALVSNSQDWWFGHLAYDASGHFDAIKMVCPEIVILCHNDHISIGSVTDDPDQVWSSITKLNLGPMEVGQVVPLKPQMPKEQYYNSIDEIVDRIKKGDFYELNFCQKFFSEQNKFSPLQLFEGLQEHSRSPFGAFYREDHSYAMCTSPERFIQKNGDRLIAQPIKGTLTKQGHSEMDLYFSEKDRAENIMIVDLIRNDLAHSCLPASINVDELFGIYAFTHVYHMISTISGELSHSNEGIEALYHLFPPGSMTGAPKIEVMTAISRFEDQPRGLYAGCIGYIAPEGDFDFNVVIRTLIYDDDTGHCSCHVGGAIVYDSNPEQEYDECLAKLHDINHVMHQIYRFAKVNKGSISKDINRKV